MLKLVPGLTRAENEVLRHVQFWMPKAKATRDGHRWVVRTAPELAGVLPYSEQTMERAVRSLSRAGFLVQEKHPHPFHTGKGHCSWLRLGPRAEGLEGPFKPTEKAPLNGPECAVQKGSEGPFIDHQFGLQIGEQLTAKADAALAGEGGGKEYPGKMAGLTIGREEIEMGVPERSKFNGKAAASSAEIMAKLKGAGLPPDADEVSKLLPLTSGQKIADVVRLAIARATGVGSGPLPTAPQKGMARNMLAAARQEKLDDADFVTMMLWACENWPDVGARLHDEHHMKVALKPNWLDLTKARFHVIADWKKHGKAKTKPAAGATTHKGGGWDQIT